MSTKPKIKKRHRHGDINWTMCKHVYEGLCVNKMYDDVFEEWLTFLPGFVVCSECDDRMRDGEGREIAEEGQQACDDCIMDYVVKPLMTRNRQHIDLVKDTQHATKH